MREWLAVVQGRKLAVTTEVPAVESAYASHTGGAPAGRLRTLYAAVRRIVGMPDYHAYLEHLRACHPGAQVPSEREYFDQYVKARYEGGPTRCC